MVGSTVRIHGLVRMTTMGRVIDLQARENWRAPTLLELVERVHALAKDSDNFSLLHPQVPAQMQRRGRTMRQVLEVLQKGHGTSGPERDANGYWRIRMYRLACGHRTHISVAVREMDFIVISVS